MKVLNANNQYVELTPMESKVYDVLKESDCMDEAYCHCPEEISDEAGIEMKQLRGVIASLVKKDVAYVDELVSGCGDWVILYEEKN